MFEWDVKLVCACPSFLCLPSQPNACPGYSPMTPGSNLDYSPRTPGSPLDTGLPTLPTDIEVVVKDMYHVSGMHSHCFVCSVQFYI